MRVRALLCLLTILGLFGTHVSAAPGIPAVVALAAQNDALSTAGVIVHERHMSVSAVAGPAHFSESNDALLLLSDGAFRHIHFVHMMENGKALAPDQISKRESENNGEFERGTGFFKQPYDRRYLTDYAYTVLPSCDCPSGQVAVRFTSALHDDQHGAGEMHIDAASGRVIDLTYAPFVFPDHANAGTVSETFGEPLPGLWTIVRIDKSYTGRVLFVSGHGTASETLDNFHRFSDADAGFAFVRTASL